MPELPVHPPTHADCDVDVPLGNDLEAPGEARRRTQVILVGWRLPELVEKVVLAVSELVTNAVTHGLPPVGLRLRRNGNRVRVDVHDDNPTKPELPVAPADGDATSGRGLGIVAGLADEMGCEPVPDDGKSVYAEFSDHDNR
jgi:anti-sigma regulatory factor (Ser/Thr protein kinase)